MIDEKSFKRIYDLYFEILCRFLHMYTPDRSVIEDIIQEVFVKLWEDRSSINIAYVKSYLMHSVRNRMLNHLRNTKNRRSKLEGWASEQVTHLMAEECIDMDEFFLVTQLAVDELPDKCRTIFNLSRRDRLQYKEIAGMLGLSVKTVEAQMGIALKRIRKRLSDHFHRPAE